MRTTNDHISRSYDTPLDGSSGRALPKKETPATIIVIERRAFIRDCIVMSLSSQNNFHVVAAASVDDWIKSDVVQDTALVILSTDGGAGEHMTKDSLQQLAQAAPHLPVVVLSDSDTADSVVDAIRKGARGYISTETRFNVAIEAMKIVQAGGTFVPASSLLSAYKRTSAVADSHAQFDSMFTSRQAAVVEALRLGKANKTIAYELNMCESTVKVHVRNIMKRPRAQNRTQVAYLVEQLRRDAGSA